MLATANLSIEGEPIDEALRRAVSSAYYALFHAVARAVADSIIPQEGNAYSEKAWHLAYRGLDHSALRNACKSPHLLQEAHPAIRLMTDIVPRMQAKRHLADYDPWNAFTAEEVADDIEDCEAAILAFAAAPEIERRAFVAFVLFKGR